MYRQILIIGTLFLPMLVVGCGGGGETSSGGGPLPSINVTLSSASGSATVTEGATAADFSADAIGVPSTKLTTTVFADVKYDNAVFSSVTAKAGTAANSYHLVATTQSNLTVGDHTGDITLRLCQDSGCNKVYAGSTVTYHYGVTVKLGDWAGFQRNAAHSGYVPITLDPANFSKAWEWQGGPNGRLKPVVTGDGAAYIVHAVSYQDARIYSLNESTGVLNWTYNVGRNLSQIGTPATGNGSVYLPFYNDDATTTEGTIVGVNAASGLSNAALPFAIQNNFLNTPVLDGDDLYFSYGKNSGQVYKFGLKDNTQKWLSDYVKSITWVNQTPAVDANYVYYNSFYGLSVFNKTDGHLAFNIDDPKASGEGYSYFGAPQITASGHVILSDLQLSLNSELVCYDIGTRSIIWRAPGRNFIVAAANGVIYSTRNIPKVMEALDEKDGSVLWSWPMPASAPSMEPNLLVTDNLLFLSTMDTTYAIDLKTHQQVWSYPAHGSLSLSANYILYIVPQEYGDPNMVTAIKLK
ncbi:MAG: PQQ-binding-like beta-propeller repeat protein [Asticcacaulis sp.]|nr:PQQ-binding-like beta-propeller repeat protein [Asticcacaulis sp.]